MSRISFLLIFIMMSKVLIMISMTIMVGGSTCIHFFRLISRRLLIYAPYTVYTVYTVFTVYAIQTALYCLNGSLYAYIYC